MGDGDERRRHERYDVSSLCVDYRIDDASFLFAYISNISVMGIFIRTEEPLPIGTELRVRFAVREGDPPLELPGMVVWINPVRFGDDNPNPGMGVRFEQLEGEERERVVAMVRTVAYLGDQPDAD